MKQPSLFDDAPEPSDEGASALPVLGVPGSAAALSRAQKAFNKLIAKIAAQRAELAKWHAFITVHQHRIASEFEPLGRELRAARIAMVMLLDRTLDRQSLVKKQREKVRHIVSGQLEMLMDDDPDAELIRLHDKYSDMSFEELQREDADLMRGIAGEVFGIDPADADTPTTPEQLAERIAESMKAAQAEPPRKAHQKKSAKAQARDDLREQAAHGATRAMREVYRKLVSELHPDREPDAKERQRKTALMQRVNQAHEAGDLLALLELQLSIEQIDPAALAGMADDRLAHYNRVLREQSLRLDEELADLTTPLAMMVGPLARRHFTPEVVQRALDADIRELKLSLRQLKADVVRYADVEQLKHDLRGYRIPPPDDDDGLDAGDELALLQSLLKGGFGRRRR